MSIVSPPKYLYSVHLTQNVTLIGGELAKDSSFSCRSRYQEGLWHMESPLEIDKKLFDAMLVKLLKTPPVSSPKRRRKAVKTGRRKSRKQL